LSGKRAEAQQVLNELQEMVSRGSPAALAVARIYVGLDEIDRAFEWLDRACNERTSEVFWLTVDPAYDSLRSDPRFHALLRRMNLLE
jgi:hypothetical protein